MAKTLIDFRAEKGLYLKDIAEKTGIPEDELRAVEQSGTVPPHIADILINDYYLPDTYFSEIVISSKVQPKSPMKYFFGVSFVYSILSGIVAAIPMYIGMMITLIVSLASRGKIDFSVTNSPIFTIFNNVWISAVSLISCIIFANFILKRTNFIGDIKKYQFLHYAVPSGIVATISMGYAYMTDFAFHMTSTENVAAVLGIEALGLIFSLATTLISVYISAILLKTAIEEDREKKFKTLKILAIVVTISSAIAYVLTILSYSIFDYDYSNYFVLIRRIFVYGLYIAVAWAVALTKTDDEKKNKIVFTVLPLISILHSVVFTIIGEFI